MAREWSTRIDRTDMKLRMPRDLHEKVRAAAEQRGVSLNFELVSRLIASFDYDATHAQALLDDECEQVDIMGRIETYFEQQKRKEMQRERRVIARGNLHAIISSIPPNNEYYYDACARHAVRFANALINALDEQEEQEDAE